MRLAPVRHATWLLAALVFAAPMAAAQVARTSFRFDFGRAKAGPGYVRVPADAVYSKELGYGFEPGGAVRDIGPSNCRASSNRALPWPTTPSRVKRSGRSGPSGAGTK